MTDKRKPLRVLEGQQPARWMLPEDFDQLEHEALVGRWAIRLLAAGSLLWFAVNVYQIFGGAL